MPLGVLPPFSFVLLGFGALSLITAFPREVLCTVGEWLGLARRRCAHGAALPLSETPD
jgi:hypothetical protein